MPITEVRGSDIAQELLDLVLQEEGKRRQFLAVTVMLGGATEENTTNLDDILDEARKRGTDAKDELLESLISIIPDRNPLALAREIMRLVLDDRDSSTDGWNDGKRNNEPIELLQDEFLKRIGGRTESRTAALESTRNEALTKGDTDKEKYCMFREGLIERFALLGIDLQNLN